MQSHCHRESSELEAKHSAALHLSKYIDGCPAAMLKQIIIIIIAIIKI